MKAFSQTEKDFIKDNWQKLSDKAISEKLGRSEKGIRQLRTRNEWFRKNGRPRTRVYKEVISKAYKIKEYKFIEDNYQTMTDPEIAMALGRTAKAITSYRHRNNLNLAKQIDYTGRLIKRTTN